MDYKSINCLSYCFRLQIQSGYLAYETQKGSYGSPFEFNYALVATKDSCWILGEYGRG
jgi:hypothetical protein